MTGSTLTAIAANPAPSPETGLISIRSPDAASVLWMPDAQCSLLPAVFFTAQCSQARFLQPPLQQPQLHRPGTPGPRISRLSSFVYRPSIRSSSFRDFFLLKNIRH